MKNKIKEWSSVYVAKNPARAILFAILLLNIVLLGLAALFISVLSPDSLKNDGFFESVFYTICMILDAGCIQFVINDIGETSVALILVCLFTIFIGMITFTGAVIGYVTNYISSFIENSNSGNRALNVSEHTVILNWNSRASEIINDLLYSNKKETIVILVPYDADNVRKQIDERISVTLREENRKLISQTAEMGFFAKIEYIHKNRLKNNLTIIIREGDTYSTKQLNDVSLLKARTVIILGQDVQNVTCKYELIESERKNEKGNSNTVKTLVQVAEITSSQISRDEQIIIVEVGDEWTAEIANVIIKHKEKIGKCNIIAVPINEILGQVLSQFSIMPELNFVYGELFSNKGAEFFCTKVDDSVTEAEYIEKQITHCSSSVPLTVMETSVGKNGFFVANNVRECKCSEMINKSDYSIKLNNSFWLEQRNIIIIGHNSNSKEIMDGFSSFREEWKTDDYEILNIIVIDDKKSLEKRDYYKDYPYVLKTVEADIFDGELIKKEISDFIDSNNGKTSILILSDDAVTTENVDTSALTYLIYVQNIIDTYCKKSNNFSRDCIDVIVEIVNPKNYDVVHSYSVKNVVISNRYISKMITQIGKKEALYEFYKDILTYDMNQDGYDSKEIYIKPVRSFFTEMPKPSTVYELIRSVYDASANNNKTLVLGYLDLDDNMFIFSGDQMKKTVALNENDKLIVFCNH